MRGQTLSLFAVLLLALSSSLVRADDVDDAQAVKDFKAIRILVWAVDPQTGAAAGFVDTQLKPGESTTVEPVAGYRIQFSAGQIKQQTITDFVREWKESAIPFTVHQGSVSEEGSQYLTVPDIHLAYAPKGSTGAVSLSIPIGSVRSPALSKLLEVKPRGEIGELEDMLIAMAKDDQLRPQSLMDAYSVVKTSQRLPQWVAMSKDEGAKGSFLALIAAARLQDPESLGRFCARCDHASGNELVRLVDLLMDMPVNPQCLDAMLRIASLPEPASLKMPPGVGVGDMDRRFIVARSIAVGYSLNDICARVTAMIDAAKPEERTRLEQRMETVLKQIDQFKNPPRPTTRPIRRPVASQPVIN